MNTTEKIGRRLRMGARWGVRAGRSLGVRIGFAGQNRLRADEWGFLLPAHFSDTYFACGLALAMRATHGGNHITAFVQPAHYFIAKLFPDIERVISVPDTATLDVVGKRELQMGIPFNTFPPPHVSVFLGRNGITSLDLSRLWLGLPLDTPLSAPRRPSSDEASRAAALADTHGLPAGRTVVLAPESNTTPEYSLDAWAALATALRAAGWTPVTNGGPKGYVVPGTVRVEIPLELCMAFVERAGWLVTMRTGLADVLSSARARLTVLYPPMRPGIVEDGVVARWYDAYSLVQMGLCTHAEEHEVAPESLVDAIPGLLDGSGVVPPGPSELPVVVVPG